MWTLQRIQTLVDASEPESLTIEYKSELPGRSDKDRAEFLKDACAMANASGGTIIFGISDQHGSASELSGLRLGDADSEIRRLSQILTSGIEPRLGSARFTQLSHADGDVLILDIPESFDQPHRYNFNGHSKFVIRNGTHTSELALDQLRSAFDKSSSRLDRIRSRWSEELSLTKLWKPIIAGPVCVVRLTPMVAADGRQVINPNEAYEHWGKLILSDWGGGSSSFNYEGLAVYHGRGLEALGGYVQVHRTGALTAYRTARVTIDDRKIIPSSTVEAFIREAVTTLTNFALLCGVRGSAVLHIGLTRLRGYEFGAGERYGFDRTEVMDLQELSLPEIWIDDLEQLPAAPDELLRPGFDLIWQSYGWAECVHYDADGRWQPPR